MNYVLDCCVLGKACHPKTELNREATSWLLEQLEIKDNVVYIPEIADYELRRKLLHLAYQSKEKTTKSIKRLDQLISHLDYLPLNTNIMRKAAHLWAQARISGVPTAGEESLDGDVILAAQAQSVSGTVVTSNVRHLSRFVDAIDLSEVT